MVSFVISELWGLLEAPPVRITSPDAPIPYAQNLEERYLPDAQYIMDQIEYLMKTGEIPKPSWEKSE